MPNLSSSTWFDFHHTLGFGFRTPTMDSFRMNAQEDGLDFFLGPPQPRETTDQMTLTKQMRDELWWDGRIGPRNGPEFEFLLNLPDSSDAIPASARRPNGYVFTLRETPTVPEPSGLLLVGLGVLGLTIVRLRGPHSRHPIMPYETIEQVSVALRTVDARAVETGLCCCLDLGSCSTVEPA